MEPTLQELERKEAEQNESDKEEEEEEDEDGDEEGEDEGDGFKEPLPVSSKRKVEMLKYKLSEFLLASKRESNNRGEVEGGTEATQRGQAEAGADQLSNISAHGGRLPGGSGNLYGEQGGTRLRSGVGKAAGEESQEGGEGEGQRSYLQN